MKRGISLIILLLCALCLQAQSDLTWIRTKEGRMVAVPKRAVFDLNLPKFTYKSFTPSDRQLIEAKLREFIPDLPVQSAYEPGTPDGHDYFICCLPAFLQSLHTDVKTCFADGIGFP